jgi:hypothetical protein
LSDKYEWKDETVDFVGSTLGTGLGTFLFNITFDALSLCYAYKQNSASQKPLVPSASHSEEFLIDPAIRSNFSSRKSQRSHRFFQKRALLRAENSVPSDAADFDASSAFIATGSEGSAFANR